MLQEPINVRLMLAAKIFQPATNVIVIPALLEMVTNATFLSMNVRLEFTSAQNMLTVLTWITDTPVNVAQRTSSKVGILEILSI